MSDLYYRFPNSLEDVQAKASHLRERARLLNDTADKAACDPIREFAALYASFAGCMELLARQLPYKAGDRVRLVKTPKCEGGWASSKHFLVVGAVGTVKFVSVDYLMRDWSLYVEFDDESHIASFDYTAIGQPYKRGDVVPTPPEMRHVYGFSPSYVEHWTADLAVRYAITDHDSGDEQA